MRFYPSIVRARVLYAAVASCLAAAAPAVHAQSVIVTDPGSFFAGINPGYYTETFTHISVVEPSASFLSPDSVFGYTITAGDTNGIFYSGDFIGADFNNVSLTVTFTTGNVTAVGGNFFNTDKSNIFQATPLTVTLNDGTTTTYTPTGESEYRGFFSSVPILSLTYAAPADTNNYSNIDNLTVGRAGAAPEPGSLLLIGVTALMPLAAVAKRRRRTAR